jgi:hypothetical protein
LLQIRSICLRLGNAAFTFPPLPVGIQSTGEVAVKIFVFIPTLLVAASTYAATPRSPNLMRYAFAPITTVAPGEAITLSGKTDKDELVQAVVQSRKPDASLVKIMVSQDGKALTLPADAFAGVTGANRAWLEERGALTTLVIEGAQFGKDWRLALEFHPKQLWLRRLSREGVARDEFTYYERKAMTAMKPQLRRAHVYGFNQD